MLRLNILKLTGWRLIAAITTPLTIATLAIYFMAFDLLERVSTGANNSARQQSEMIVDSALVSLREQLGNLIVDNANWDDAARNAYDKLTVEWAQETWGYSTQDGLVYQHMAIIDQTAQKSFVAFKRGVAVDINPVTFYKGYIDEMVAAMGKNPKKASRETAIIPTADGLAVVAVGPIMPVSDEIVIPAKPRYLVFTKFISPEMISALSKQYVISDLNIAASTSAPGNLNVMGPDGHVVADVSWSPPRPGDSAYQEVTPKVLTALVLLTMVMASLGIGCWQLSRALLEREAKTRHAAFHDGLTGLSNRASLMSHLAERVVDKNSQTAIAFADIDGFKDVNDTYDHQTGDRLIQFLAKLQRQIAGPDQFIARIGGDEFVTLFTGPDCETKARAFSDKFIDALKDPINIEGRFAKVGASIGIVSTDDRSVTVDELLRRADIAMYTSKTDGKNQWRIYSDCIDRERLINLQIGRELQDIIAEKSIAVAYQPIVSAATRKISAVEVLARWPKSSSSYFTPAQFIQVAENMGLIDDLGDTILSNACAEAKDWGDVRLCINVSPIQLRNPNFVERAMSVVHKHGIDPSRIEFEITEQVLVEDLNQAHLVIKKLKDAGVSVALDDFGSGHSSVGYLRKLSFDRIKIDKGIVDGILAGRIEQGIAQGLGVMAKAMGAEITAEGIENEEQAKLMRLVGCDELQGYHFHRPMSRRDVVNRMVEERYPQGTTGPKAFYA